MEVIGRKHLTKLKKKNLGNVLLGQAIDDLLNLIESKSWASPSELKADRPGADLVHSDGFYFFDLNVHRTMILIEFEEESATIEWCGSHDEYEMTFKNNRNTIKKWLKSKG